MNRQPINKDVVKTEIHHLVAPRMKPENKRAEVRSKRNNKQISRPKKKGKK